jgi:uncharacterized membrane protein YjgN (DUF898 family)
LTRTVFRGLRFHQDGSGWLYALFAILWWSLIIVSFGLAYPWAQASLQRYMMRHTSYGKLPGRFDGSGWRLFVRGLPLWLVSLGPLLAAGGFAVSQIDWQALGSVDSDGSLKIDFAGPLGAEALIGFAVGGLGLSVLFAILLYPVFQAIVYRWWLSGLRFGDIAVTSRLRIGRVYVIYLRYVGFVFLFMIAAGAAGGLLFGAFFALLSAVQISTHQIPGRELIGAGVGLLVYAAFALVLAAMHQVLVTFGLWRAAAQSAEISNAPILDTIEAKAGLSSALGEGLVDALGFGSV